jgi:hypothetical protein
VESKLHVSLNSLSSKSTVFGVGVGEGNGNEVGVGTELVAKLEAVEQASMAASNSTEEETIFEFLIFAPKNKKLN